MTGLTPEPNYHGRKLQRAIKRLREEARLTQQEAGERVHIEFRKLSRMERRQLPTYHELVMLLDAYGVLSCDFEPYLELWELARQRSWWREYQLEETHYIRMEDEADTKYEFQLGHIPTLLQTEEYARSVLSRHSNKTTKNMLTVRMRQQERLTTEPSLTLHTLIHEPVLHQGVDRAQIRKLLDSTTLPTVTIQIVPQTHIHDGVLGSLILLSFDDPAEPDIAFNDSLVGLQESQSPDKTSVVKRTLDHIASIAMSPADSTRLLHDMQRQPSR